METVFDCSTCGLGDAVVASWIAQGARDSGHNVVFTRGSHVDQMLEAFGFPRVASEGIRFGGTTESYKHELDLEVQLHPRTVVWQRGMPFSVTAARPTATLDAAPLSWAQELRDNRSGREPLVLLFPYANFAPRQWPTAKWIRLAHELEAMGIKTIAAHKRKEGLEHFPFFVYGYDLRHVMSLISHSSVVLANDSGPAHLAGTLGTPTLAVMGPTNPNTVFGYCQDITTIHSPRMLIPCTGCHFKFDKGYTSLCDMACESLMSLRVSKVKEAALKLLRKANG